MTRHNTLCQLINTITYKHQQTHKIYNTNSETIRQFLCHQYSINEDINEDMTALDILVVLEY